MSINLLPGKLPSFVWACIAFISIILLSYLVMYCDGLERIPLFNPGKISNSGLRITDHGTYLAYVPDGLAANRKYPLVFALSPSSDALSLISKWSKIADKHLWIVAASKEFRNGVAFDITLHQLEAELNDVEQKYNVNTNRIIFTGLSGGGMGAHAFSKFYPHRVSAVVINTGMMEHTFMTPNYPQAKQAVFLASPTDFRYNEMKRDKAFLESHEWSVKWIEFTGGHALAPDISYDQAAEWLQQNFDDGR
ncbi:MAG: hypothetical protein ACLP5H_09515 [Desulfomonilaceae bacterium]